MGVVQNIVQGSAEIWLDGVNMGLTYEAVTQSLEREYTDIIVEQVKGPVATELVMENCSITTTLAEITLTNIKTAWDQSASSLIGGTFLSIGTEGGANEHTLTIVSKAPKGSTYTYRNFYFFKVVSYETVEIASARGEQTKLAITFKCMKDIANGNMFGYANESNTKGA